MTCPTMEKLWLASKEYHEGLKKYLERYKGTEQGFRSGLTHEFRCARLAFRRRMNNSPDAETT